MDSISSYVEAIGASQPAVTGADVIKGYELAGRDFAEQLLSYGRDCLAQSTRRDNALCASVRSASASGSSAGSRPSFGVTGLTGTRLASIAKVDNWRKTGDDLVEVNATKKIKYPDGLCYAKLFGRRFAEDQAMRSGQWPTFGSIARLSCKKFRPLADLERFRIVPKGDGLYHVATGGQRGGSFLDAVALYGKSIAAQPGTLASAVLETGRLVGDDAYVVSGSARLGGSAVVQSALRLVDSVPVPSTAGGVCVVKVAQSSAATIMFDRFAGQFGGSSGVVVRSGWIVMVLFYDKTNSYLLSGLTALKMNLAKIGLDAYFSSSQYSVEQYEALTFDRIFVSSTESFAAWLGFGGLPYVKPVMRPTLYSRLGAEFAVVDFLKLHRSYLGELESCFAVVKNGVLSSSPYGHVHLHTLFLHLANDKAFLFDDDSIATYLRKHYSFSYDSKRALSDVVELLRSCDSLDDLKIAM